MNWQLPSRCFLATPALALALPVLALAQAPAAAPVVSSPAIAQPAPASGVPVKIEGDGIPGWIQVQVQPIQSDGQPVRIEGSELPAQLQMLNRQAGGALVGKGRYATTQPGMGPGASFWLKMEQPTEKAAYLGLSLAPPGAALRQQLKLAKGMGLVVTFVDPEGPAKAAGVQQHDVLTKLDDQLLVNMPQLSVLVRSHKAGDTVKLTLIREAKSQEIPVKLAEKDLPIMEEGFEENEGGMYHPAPQLVPLPGGAGWNWGGMPAPVPAPGTAGSAGAGPPGTPRVIITTANGNAPIIAPPGAGGMNPYRVESGGGAYRYSAPAGRIFLADKEYTIQLNVAGPKDAHLTVTERATGKNLFDGPINTDEQRKGLEALPESVRSKVTAARTYAEGLQLYNDAAEAPRAPAPNPAPAPEKK